jgi:hypothetical protein
VGIPAHRPALVLRAPPWWTTTRQAENRRANFGAVAAHHLDVEMWDVAWKTCSIWTTGSCHAIGQA